MSIAHNLDPRTKLALAVGCAAVIVRSGAALWLLAELGVVVLLVLAVGEGRAYLRWLGAVAVMSGAWFAIAWWAFGPEAAALAGLRLVALLSVFFLFFRTTAPEDLGNALVQAGLPYELAFVLSAALQFVPVIGRKAHNIIDAQRARGIPLEPGLAALRHYPALFTPLLIQAFQLADELAEAMDARGFGRPGRTFLREYRLRARDWLALAGGLALLTAALAFID
jgi:energy-coupling factor transport system permease protein